MNPSISIIVPCYNQGLYIRETLDCILGQELQTWECILVNDGSTDNTMELIREYERKDQRFHVIDKINEGPAIARNIAIAKAKGEYILPLDSDDLIDPTYTRKAINYFNEHPECKLIYCQAAYFGIVNKEWKLPDYNYKNLLWENCIFCSAIYRKKDFEKTDGYNPNMREAYEDWDFWLTFLKENDVVYRIPETLFYYRQHETSRNKSSSEKIDIAQRKIVLNHLDLYEPYLGKLISWNYTRQKYNRLKSSKALRIGEFILTPWRWFARSFLRM